MFVILNITESGKRKIRKGQTVSNVSEISVHGGERFYVVDVKDSEKGVNWFDVASFIGQHSNKVLMDRRFDFSEFVPLCRFEPMHFKNILLFNTAEIILKELYLSGMRIKCSINDPNGNYSAYLRKTARFAAQTTVITNNEFRYFAEIQSVYLQLGAGITISQNKAAENKNNFMIDTVDCSISCGGYKFTPFSVDGFNYLRVMCPSYIDAIDFFGAFFELNKYESLSSAFCRSMLCENICMTVSEMVDVIKSLDGEAARRRKNIIFYV